MANTTKDDHFNFVNIKDNNQINIETNNIEENYTKTNSTEENEAKKNNTETNETKNNILKILSINEDILNEKERIRDIIGDVYSNFFELTDKLKEINDTANKLTKQIWWLYEKSYNLDTTKEK